MCQKTYSCEVLPHGTCKSIMWCIIIFDLKTEVKDQHCQMMNMMIQDNRFIHFIYHYLVTRDVYVFVHDKAKHITKVL